MLMRFVVVVVVLRMTLYRTILFHMGIKQMRFLVYKYTDIYCISRVLLGTFLHRELWAETVRLCSMPVKGVSNQTLLFCKQVN